MRAGGMLAPRVAHVVGASALVILVACNALNGASDLRIGDCEGCGAEGGVGIEGGADGVGGGDGPSNDGPKADVTSEGSGGFLDPSFGSGGIVALDNVLNDARAVAVRSDGRILVVGEAQNELAAVALIPSGVLDMTFGTNGRILVNGTGSSSTGRACSFDSKGRALVAGSEVVVAGMVSNRYAYAARIDGSLLDATFGSGGRWRGGSSGQEACGIVATANDAPVVAVVQGDDYAFWRLSAGGTVDGTFGDMGEGTVFNVGGQPGGLVAVTDGFVSGGTGNAPGIGRAFAAAKVSLSGVPVATFGALGKAFSRVSVDDNQGGRAIALQADGKIVIAGDYDPRVPMVKRVGAVTRLSPAGGVDATYGSGGKVAIDLTEPLVGRETETTSSAAVIDTSGRALVVGTVFDKPVANTGDRTRVWIARLRADGSFDPLFGTNGKLFIGTAPARLEARGAALQPDGKLVVVGANQNGNTMFVARIVTSTIK